jgi:K+-transporting ATPase c subunit
VVLPAPETEGHSYARSSAAYRDLRRLVRLSAGGIAVATLQAEKPGVPVPIDLATASASGIDPAISPQFQIPRIAKARSMGAANTNPG